MCFAHMRSDNCHSGSAKVVRREVCAVITKGIAVFSSGFCAKLYHSGCFMLL